MKHLIPDLEAEKQLDGNGSIKIFSCEYDDGKKTAGVAEPLRLGPDGMIFFFPCTSCEQQIREHALFPVLVQATRESMDGRPIKELFDAIKERPVVKIGNQEVDA